MVDVSVDVGASDDDASEDGGAVNLDCGVPLSPPLNTSTIARIISHFAPSGKSTNVPVSITSGP